MKRALTRGRSIAVLGLLLAAALGLIAATQPWGGATLHDGRTPTVTGQELAGALTVMSLASAVLGLVMAIAGRVWRYVLGALAVLLGGALFAHVQAAREGIVEAIDVLIADATGLAGTAQDAEVASMQIFGIADAGVAAGIVAAAAGLWVLATAHGWPARVKRAARYERSGSGLAWDVMDDGDDPTR